MEELNVWTIIAIIISVLAVVVPIYKYLADSRLKNADNRFKIYHALIKNLVQSELLEVNPIEKDESGHKFQVQGNVYGTMAHRQVATIFELRNFPEYFEVTCRILEDLKIRWEKEDTQGSAIILKEIKYTTEYIDAYRKPIHCLLRSIFLGPLSKNIIVKQGLKN